MKVGDLVKYGPKMAGASNRMGVVVGVSMYEDPSALDSFLTGLRMVEVRWNGIGGPMKHRCDVLEVVSESR